MAKITAFKANPQLAAMSQKASQLLAGKNMASGPGGNVFQMSGPKQYASSFLGQRQSQLTGSVRSSQAMTQALLQPTMRAPSRAEIYAAAAGRAAQAAQDPHSYGNAGQLENMDQFGVSGMSGEDLQAAAARYASGRSYGGGEYRPGMVMQEGSVTYQGGRPGVMIKYRTPQGDTTEWTPI